MQLLFAYEIIWEFVKILKIAFARKKKKIMNANLAKNTCETVR